MKLTFSHAFLLAVVTVAALLAASQAHDDYDVIVVGAGTAGCEVAALIAANPRIRILLLGEGEMLPYRPYNVIPLINPSDADGVPSDFIRFAESILSIEGPNTGRTSNVIVRPNNWSGASEVNGGAFVFPDDQEWVRFAELGVEGWTKSKMTQYRKNIEKFLPANGGPVPAGHGTNGPIQTRIITPEPRLEAFMRSMMAATGTSYNPDTGLGNINGTGYYVRPLGGPESVVATGNYTRQDSCNRFIFDQAHKRNLDMKMNARVLKVDKDGDCKKSGNSKCVNRVTYSINDKMFTSKIKKDGKIILSAGALATPKILMQSGIGDCSVLSPRGISCFKNLPAVGKDISDHIVFGQIYVTMPSPEWTDHRGSIVSTYKASSLSERGAMDIQMSYTSYPAASGLQVVLVMNVLTQPYSLGEIILRGSDWNSQINITFGVANDPRDMPRIIEMFNYVRAGAANVTANYPAAKRDSQEVLDLDTLATLNPEMKKTIDCVKMLSTGTVSADLVEECSLKSIMKANPNHDTTISNMRREVLLTPPAGMTEIYPGAALPAGATPAQIAAFYAPVIKADYHTVGSTRIGVCSTGAVVDSRLHVCDVANLMVADNGIYPKPLYGHNTHPAALLVGAFAADVALEDLA